MNDSRPAISVRPTPRWLKLRPSEARRQTDGGEKRGESEAEGKPPRRTLTVIFRAN